jgi:AmmeMemoRadiSam system protein B
MQPRLPAVAGKFYPGDAKTLMADVKGFLEAAPSQGGSPKALIAPHAGFIYSGPVAASAYAEVRTLAGKIQRIILLGPSHHALFKGVASVAVTSFLTPMGAVTVDHDAIAEVVALGFVHISDAAHAAEHCLEVHLPFVQFLFPSARIVPLLTGDGDASSAQKTLEHLWGGDETLIVISSDLSHYLDYSQAQRIDCATARKIQQLAANAIEFNDACGATAINALLSAATNRGLVCRLLDLRNSGDTSGPHDRVVGYGAFAFT